MLLQIAKMEIHDPTLSKATVVAHQCGKVYRGKVRPDSFYELLYNIFLCTQKICIFFYVNELFTSMK